MLVQFLATQARRKESPVVVERTQPMPAPFRAPQQEEKKQSPNHLLRWVMGGLAVVLLVGACWIIATQKQGAAKDGEVASDKPITQQQQQQPTRISKFLLHHYRIVDGKSEDHGEIGKESFEPNFDDWVKFQVSLSEKGYLYLIAFNPNGEEQLLWPCEDLKEGKPAPNTPPQAVDRLNYPLAFRLSDEPAGGLQAFAVVASRQPLQAYALWKKSRGPVPWSKRIRSEGVWLADQTGVYRAQRGIGVVRCEVRQLPGAPPLEELVRALQVGGAETVEVWAFPVRAKEENE
jgi:hypothetical protein